MESKTSNLKNIFKRLLIAESFLWFLGAIFVTNMSPDWQRIAMYVLTFLVIGTAILFAVTWFSVWWSDPLPSVVNSNR
ncbi:MAG: hypothetical protein ACW98Y_15260 [Candidatus Thorarchaeota archaeon]